MKIVVLQPAVNQNHLLEQRVALCPDHDMGLGHVTLADPDIDRESGLGHVTMVPNDSGSLYNGRIDIIDWIKGKA